jgi:hypothetical protein
MIEAVTWIYFIPIWLHSLFQSSQNVSSISKQLLCWKCRSTSSVIFSKWILAKFCYLIYTRKVIMFLVKQNNQWWDGWLVNNQVILFVITSISLIKITRDCAMKYHGKRGKNTMGRGQNIMGSGFKISSIRGSYAIGRGSTYDE